MGELHWEDSGMMMHDYISLGMGNCEGGEEAQVHVPVLGRLGPVQEL
jgi:hypothetical protein